jgi:hypothetical protein
VAFWLAALPTVAVEYKWTLVKKQAVFAPRDGAGALTFNNRMWLLGGWNPGDAVHFPKIANSEVWKSADGANWTLVTRQAAWEGRHTAGYVVFNNKMWIVGGDPIQGHYQPDVWNTSDGVNWTRVAASTPWGGRCLHYTVVHNSKIWVMGGQTLPEFAPGPLQHYNDVWSSSDGMNWTQVTANAPWSPRGMICGAVEFKGRMWVIGGGQYPSGGKPRTYDTDVWSSADGVSWTQAITQAPWLGRNYHNVSVFDDHIWLLGGSHEGVNLNDVWYSSDGASWSELPNTPWAPRHAASVFVYNNALWMVTGNNMQSDVWRLDVVPEPSIRKAGCGWCSRCSDRRGNGGLRHCVLGIDNEHGRRAGEMK